jgi:hypothetical protein
MREVREKPKREGEEETRVDVVEGIVGLPWTLSLSWVGGSCGGGDEGVETLQSLPR